MDQELQNVDPDSPLAIAHHPQQAGRRCYNVTAQWWPLVFWWKFKTGVFGTILWTWSL